MKIQVLPDALVESPTRPATGVDRRAFGLFVGPRGELASYAFGWTTDAQPHVARLSIGIGAGNPGGATIHAFVFQNKDGHAFSLVDEPFEDVPQGGPDLTADQARAHRDLPFMWWVADQAMEHDQRARWMRHWLLGTPCIQASDVAHRRSPILLVRHGNDGVWQLTGTSGADVTGAIGHLHHAIDADPTLTDVLDLPRGHSVTRTHVGGAWTRHRRYRNRRIAIAE